MSRAFPSLMTVPDNIFGPFQREYPMTEQPIQTSVHVVSTKVVLLQDLSERIITVNLAGTEVVVYSGI